MPISPVELYEKLKNHLGEANSKALIEYMDEKIRGEVATKEDLLLVKGELQKEIQGVRGEVQGLRGEMKEETWKLRILMIVVMAIVVVFNPK